MEVSTTYLFFKVVSFKLFFTRINNVNGKAHLFLQESILILFLISQAVLQKAASLANFKKLADGIFIIISQYLRIWGLGLLAGFFLCDSLNSLSKGTEK